MAAMAGLFNHGLTAGQALTGSGASPMAASPAATGSTGSTSSTDSGDSSSSTISANDFLTLLVTEMQNQDPTADTDPNEYINQLVQVNSLEQLISINQNLSTALGDSGSSSSASTSSSQASTAPGVTGQTSASASSVTGTGLATKAAPGAAHGVGAAGHRAAALHPATAPGSGAAAAISQFAQSVGARSAPGNLGIPQAHAAAHKVARALDGQPHAARIPGKPAGAQ